MVHEVKGDDNSKGTSQEISRLRPANYRTFTRSWHCGPADDYAQCMCVVPAVHLQTDSKDPTMMRPCPDFNSVEAVCFAPPACIDPDNAEVGVISL